MEYAHSQVVESVDIAAPRAYVFQVVANCDRRLQLSPLWGLTEIQNIAPNFPEEGSYYHVKPLVENGEDEYDAIITSFVPNYKFAYQLTAKRGTRVTWSFQDVSQGTRLIYHEEFLVDEAGDDHFVQTVSQVVRQWLENIKRYAELGTTGLQRLVKWALDNHLLKLRAEQRRVILLLLALQGVTMFSFIAIAIGWSLVSLVF